MTETKRWIYFFGEGTCEGDPKRKDILGGKGASLAAMSCAGLAVPPGFTLSVECCQYYHQNGQKWPQGLEAELRQYLARLEKVTGRQFGQSAKPLLVSVRSGAAASMPGMMDTLLNCGLHPGLAGQMKDPQRFWQVYAQFIKQFGKTVADIPDSAYEKYADLTGPEKAEGFRRVHHERTGKPFPTTPWDVLVACIDAVFESWNNERAITYRKAQDIRGVYGTAVNVQSMFPSEVSGIAFTANPADPYANEIVIESSYGLGEAIVSGLVTPDMFVIDRSTLKIKNRTLGQKGHGFASMETSASAVAEDGEAFSLTDAQVEELVGLALKVENYYGYPVDVEWGVADGRFALLQARAVRGLEVARDTETGRLEEIERLKRLSGGKRKVWVIHNLAETLGAPTPLTWDVMSRFMSGNGGFGRMYQDFGYRPSQKVLDQGFLELICGKIYLDPERASELFWGNMPLEYDLDEVAEDPAIVELAPTKFNAEHADATFFLRAPGLIRAMLRASSRMKRARREAKARFEAVLPDYLAYVRAKRAQKLESMPTPEVISELKTRMEKVLGDFGKESLKPGFFGGLALADLERQLIQLMGESEGRSLAGVLTSGLEGDTTLEQNMMLFEVSQGESSLKEFLELYGHRTVNEMELAQPRWREDSSYLDRVLEGYRRDQTRSPHGRHARNVEAAHKAHETLPERLAEFGGSSLVEDVREMILEAQSLLPYREAGKHYLMMGYEVIRLAIEELARRWELGRDVFFLRLEELGRYESERKRLSEEIARRKMRWQSAQRLATTALIDSDHLDTLGVPPSMDEATELKGQPLAPGVVEGHMRIIFSPNEASELPTDCILVCPSTDPGWTALFASIRGLVVERGGMLSHGAITARDFGIPAVACADATSLLKHASRLRIDGNKGQVTILDGE